MSNSIKRKAIPIATMVMAIVMMGPAVLSTAFAVPPTNVERTGGLHFVGTPDVTRTADNRLVVTGEVAGAGTQATAELTATAQITQGCINPGSKSHEPRGLQTISDPIAVTQELEPTRQGRATINFQTDPITAPVGGFSCPGKMTPTLVSVTFTDITLTVTSQTGTLVATFPNL